MSDKHGNLQKHLNANPLQQTLLDRFHRQIIKLVQSTGAKTILDAGCGEGFTLNDLQKANLLTGVQVAAIDFSAGALAWHKDNRMSAAELNQADIHHLPFADSSFDLVYSLEVLEHLPDSAVGLRELLRVSRQYVLISVPHEPFFRGANFLRGKHIAAWGNDPEHLHNYSGQAFKSLVGKEMTILWHGYSFPWQIILGHR